MAANKKLATLHMGYNRVITGLVTMPDSDGYYEVQIVKIENPIVDDWKENDVVKIGKELIQNVIWNT